MSTPRPTEECLVAAQIGRRPRSPWRVSVRCRFGAPQVIASPSRLDDGTPFPTTFWLTCPHLMAAVSAEESRGEVSAWASRLASDAEMAETMRAADEAYRAARERESGGVDACASTGVAGQSDPLATKCLHAHAASALAGVGDPIGEALLLALGRECDSDVCATIERASEGDGGHAVGPGGRDGS